MVTFSMTLTDP